MPFFLFGNCDFFFSYKNHPSQYKFGTVRASRHSEWMRNINQDRVLMMDNFMCLKNCQKKEVHKMPIKNHLPLDRASSMTITFRNLVAILWLRNFISKWVQLSDFWSFSAVIWCLDTLKSLWYVVGSYLN